MLGISPRASLQIGGFLGVSGLSAYAVVTVGVMFRIVGQSGVGAALPATPAGELSAITIYLQTKRHSS